jgi:SPP1 family predicted phage head-tail adaptor
MKLFDPGKLRHRITIERMQSIVNDDGDVIGEGWSNVAECWASIEPLSARELLSAQAIQSEVTARITIRARSNIDHSCRIQFGGTIYNIAGVIPDPNSGSEWMTLPVTNGINQG